MGGIVREYASVEGGFLVFELQFIRNWHELTKSNFMPTQSASKHQNKGPVTVNKKIRSSECYKRRVVEPRWEGNVIRRF